MRVVLGHRQTRVVNGEKTVKPLMALFMLAGLTLASGMSTAAEPLGRLFFTPAQRAQLDTARSQKSRVTLANEQAQDAAPVAEILTLDGTVSRSDGKSTVWINNHAVNDRDAYGGVVVERVKPNVLLHVPQTTRSIDLKVGQSVDIVSGTIEEPFARQVTAPKPAAAEKTAAKPAPAQPPAPGDKAAADARTPEQKILETQLKSALERLKNPPAGGNSNAPVGR